MTIDNPNPVSDIPKEHCHDNSSTPLTLSKTIPENLKHIQSATFREVVPAILYNMKYELENIKNITCFSYAHNYGFLAAGVVAAIAAFKYKKDFRVFKYATYAYFVGNVFAWNICRMRHKVAFETGIHTMNNIRNQTMDENGNPRLGIAPGIPPGVSRN